MLENVRILVHVHEEDRPKWVTLIDEGDRCEDDNGRVFLPDEVLVYGSATPLSRKQWDAVEEKWKLVEYEVKNHPSQLLEEGNSLN